MLLCGNVVSFAAPAKEGFFEARSQGHDAAIWKLTAARTVSACVVLTSLSLSLSNTDTAPSHMGAWEGPRAEGQARAGTVPSVIYTYALFYVTGEGVIRCRAGAGVSSIYA